MEHLGLCEELSGGQCWDVDPEGLVEPKVTLVGGEKGGFFEAFAADDRDPNLPCFFITEDKDEGALRKFRPDPSIPFGREMLTDGNASTLEYLEILDDSHFRWTPDIVVGRQSAAEHFPNTEAIVHYNGLLSFVAKKIR